MMMMMRCTFLAQTEPRPDTDPTQTLHAPENKKHPHTPRDLPEFLPTRNSPGNDICYVMWYKTKRKKDKTKPISAHGIK